MDNDPMWQHQAQAQPFESMAYYQCDHLGTPMELTDMNGETAWSAQYKAWGLATQTISDAAKRAGLKNPIRFQGQYYDHETGLHYNRHRYYDPHCGRYLSKDPIGLSGGWNLHGYVKNPVHWIDPMGLQCEKRPLSVLRETLADMQKINLRGHGEFGPDQYFHCIAFCRASRTGCLDSKERILGLGKAKEQFDYLKNIFGQYGNKKLSHSDMVKDMDKDEAVNAYGFSASKNVGCLDHCRKYLQGVTDKDLQILKSNSYYFDDNDGSPFIY